MFIPLNPEVGLELRRQADLPPLWQRVPGGRAAVLGRGEVKPEEMPTINRYIAEDARREVYGQQKKDVAAVQVASQRPRNPRMPAQVLTDYTADAPNPPDGDWLRELSHAGIEWPTLPVLTILNLQE
jgi:hypothetical protein